MKLFCQTIVGFLDLSGGSSFTNAEDIVWILRDLKIRGCVKWLFEENISKLLST
jgi:hypothetical protein